MTLNSSPNNNHIPNKRMHPFHADKLTHSSINKATGIFSSSVALKKALGICLDLEPGKSKSEGAIKVSRDYDTQWFIAEYGGGAGAIGMIRIKGSISDIKDISRLLDEYTNDTTKRVMTWNIAISWQTDYEGAWQFDQVAQTIDAKGPDVLCMQEVPVIESTLGRQNYLSRLNSFLKDWGYEVFEASRDRLSLVTAIKNDTSPLIIHEQKTRYYPGMPYCQEFTLKLKDLDITNVHRQRGATQEIWQQYVEGQPTTNTLVCGDFNYDPTSHAVASGAYITQEGLVETGDDLDHVLLNHSLVKHDVVDISPELPLKRHSEKLHYHRPVIADLSSKDLSWSTLFKT
jgi:hypothetical protein